MIRMAEYIVSVEKQEDVDEIERTYAYKKLVRCKDCRYRPEVKKIKVFGRIKEIPVFPEDSICPACNTSDSYYSWNPSDDWFCADGEPKDGEQE